MIKLPIQIVAIDAGHTRVKLGVYTFDGQKRLPAAQLTHSVMNDADFTWDWLRDCSQNIQQHHILLTGSNRAKIAELTTSWPMDIPTPMTLASKSEIPITSRVEVPERVGADRLLNGVAVNLLRDSDRSAIIIDSGTAMTVDAISPSGEFLGGAILPGILMSARGLNQFTSTLPLIDGREFLNRSPSPIGRNTEDAMASGLYWGHLGAARELYSRINLELGGNGQCFLTGGAGSILQPFWSDAIYHADLSLLGIALTAKHLLEKS